LRGGLPRHILEKTTVFRKKGVEIWVFDGTLMIPKFFSSLKMHYKKAAFYADLESIEKVAKKVNSKKETENDFFDFYCCMQKLSAYNFVGGELFCIFFFNGFRLSI
jgi:hypothetical protein